MPSAYPQSGLRSAQVSTRRGISLRRTARGVIMRGVVTEVYAYDASVKDVVVGHDRPAAVYADVLCYSGMPGGRYHFIPRCIVSYEYAGHHDGDIRVPRRSSHGFGKVAKKTFNLETGGNTLSTAGTTVTSPMMMDGDHVLVGFIDDRLEQGVILRHIPHPRCDTGKPVTDAATGKAPLLGDRLKIVEADGHPRGLKHHGTFAGVTSDGSVEVNLRKAHQGDGGDGTAAGGGGYDPATGNEVASTQLAPETHHTKIDPTTRRAGSGNVVLRLPDNATFSVEYPATSVASQGGCAERFRLSHDNGPGGLGSVAEVRADYVLIGSPADIVGQLEPAVLGASWGAARSTLNREVEAKLDDVQTAVTTLSTAGTALAAVLAPLSLAGGDAPAGAVNTYVTAVGAFLTTLKAQLTLINLAINTFEEPSTGAEPLKDNEHAYLSAHTSFVEKT